MSEAKETTDTHAHLVDRERMDRIEALLRRYPALDEAETGDLLRFVREGPALELALLTGNEELRPQLERFQAANAKALAIGMREIAVILALVVVVLAAVILLWDAGADS